MHANAQMSNFSAEQICALYGSDLRRFRELAAKHDPTGKFRNEWAEQHLFTGEC